MCIPTVNPRNCRTLVGFLGTGQSVILLSFFGSMRREFWLTITPRYSISFFSNSHLSGLKYKLFCSSMSRTWCVYCLYCA